MYSIYKRTNRITNRCYIGLTKQPEKMRWKQHILEVKYHPNTKLSRAIKKYGYADSMWLLTILETGIADKKTAGEREIFWIWKHDSYKNGYNSTPGGNIPPEERARVAVVLLDYNTGEYYEFEDVKQAASVVGCHWKGITKALYKERLTIYNYYVFHKRDFNPNQIQKYLELPRIKYPRVKDHKMKVCGMR